MKSTIRGLARIEVFECAGRAVVELDWRTVSVDYYTLIVSKSSLRYFVSLAELNRSRSILAKSTFDRTKLVLGSFALSHGNNLSGDALDGEPIVPEFAYF